MDMTRRHSKRMLVMVGALACACARPSSSGLAEFLAYRDEVNRTIKSHWQPTSENTGLVAKVGFEIAPDGAVGGVRLAGSSGNADFDQAALRAVQDTPRVAPPPARFVEEFRRFLIEFHGD
jgi:TonB family protein